MAVAEIEVLERAPTLEELAETANREHEATVTFAREAVEHAIRAGEALIAARACIEGGSWLSWLEENFAATQQTAARYMRLAHYAEVVRAQQGASIRDSYLWIRGLPGPFRKGGPGNPYPQQVKDEAKALRSAGASYTEIARLLGIRPSTVGKWLNPEQARRAAAASNERARLRRQAHLKAEEGKREQRIRAAARKAGGGIADLYALSERMQDVMGRAHGEATDATARRHLSEAGTHYRKMRDEIVRALGVS